MVVNHIVQDQTIPVQPVPWEETTVSLDIPTTCVEQVPAAEGMDTTGIRFTVVLRG